MMTLTITAMFLLLGSCAAYPPAKGRVVLGDSPPAQVPPVFEALAVLQNNKTADGIYPQYAAIPPADQFTCTQPGYYADVEFQCQVYRRCDLDGNMTSYLCPSQSLFNQITLICDWYYNVDCSLSSRFNDYSNARLYGLPSWPLFTDAVDVSSGTGQEDIVQIPDCLPLASCKTVAGGNLKRQH